MEWKLYNNSLILCNEGEREVEGSLFSKIIKLNKTINFSFDEVTNVTHNIELFNLDRAFYENNLDIFSFKIDVNLRVEYGEDIKK
ncbi:MAG: hypothetical protein ACRC2K_03015, partial [Clostridium sp.]